MCTEYKDRMGTTCFVGELSVVAWIWFYFRLGHCHKQSKSGIYFALAWALRILRPIHFSQGPIKFSSGQSKFWKMHRNEQDMSHWLILWAYTSLELDLSLPTTYEQHLKMVPSELCTAKIQISLRFCTDWSKSSLGAAFWIGKYVSSCGQPRP